MHNSSLRRWWLAGALLLALSPSVTVSAQDHDHEPQSMADVHARMRELMGKIETRLKSIDDLLNDASARSQSSTAAAGQAAVDQVLTKSRDSARQNVDDIDEILRLSLHPHEGGGGGGGA